MKPSAMPTRKWVAAQVVLLGGIAINAVDTGWSAIETKAIILWLIQGLTTYLVPNDPTTGGVPMKRSRSAGQASPVGLALLLLIVVVVLFFFTHSPLVLLLLLLVVLIFVL